MGEILKEQEGGELTEDSEDATEAVEEYGKNRLPTVPCNDSGSLPG